MSSPLFSALLTWSHPFSSLLMSSELVSSLLSSSELFSFHLFSASPKTWNLKMSKRNFCARPPKNWKLMWKPSFHARLPSEMTTWSCKNKARTVSSNALIQTWPDHGRDCLARFVLQNARFRASTISQKRILCEEFWKQIFPARLLSKTASWRCQNNPFNPFYARSPSNLQREVAKMKPEPSIPMRGRFEHGDMWWLRFALSKPLLLGWSLMRKVFPGCYTSMILVSNSSFPICLFFWGLLYD